MVPEVPEDRVNERQKDTLLRVESPQKGMRRGQEMKHSPTHTHSMRQGEVILGPPLVNIASELAGDRLVGGGGVSGGGGFLSLFGALPYKAVQAEAPPRVRSGAEAPSSPA